MTDLGIRALFAGVNRIGAVKTNGSSQRTAFKLRQMGDRCRNRHNWQEARENYSRYLNIVPEDAAIWVQYGHSCKELGDLEAAEAAYEKSIEIMPGSDAYIALGRVLKIKSEVLAAGMAFRKAAELEAGFDLVAGFGEGRAEMKRIPAPRNDAATMLKRVLIDLSDVLFYLSHHNTVSGIQRVQLGLAEALLRMLPELPYKLAFVCGRDDGSGWLEIDNAHLKTLIGRMAAPAVDHEKLRDLIGQIAADAASYEPAQGDLFLILGAFWVIEHVVEQIAAVHRAGAITGVLIHDLIPIVYPEFCEKSLTDEFQLFAENVLRIADFILTVSDHTGREVSGYLHEKGISAPPISTLRSAHRTWEHPNNAPSYSPSIARLAKRRYVLYVSTIEIRKNHLYLFQVWKRLQQELGDAVPTLVFVGRTGWRIDDLMAQMESTDFLHGKIEIVNGLSDPELAELYRNCLFTVFPSFVEGWGLPIGESLIFGRPCIASQTSSLPEVAGEFVDYLDPLNMRDGYEKIKKFIMDDAFRESRAAAIKARFKPRLWGDVAADLLRIIEQRASEPRVRHEEIEPPVLHPGVIYHIGHGRDRSEHVRSGRAALVRAICDTNWHGIEDWGRWMRGRSASLRLQLLENKPCPITLMLEFRTVAGFRGSVRIGVDEALCYNCHLDADSTERFIIRTTPRDRTIQIHFESTDQIIPEDDPRPLSIGIMSIAYAPMDDLAARLSLLDALNAQLCDLRPLQGSIGRLPA